MNLWNHRLIFQITNSKIWRISALKFLTLNISRHVVGTLGSNPPGVLRGGGLWGPMMSKSKESIWINIISIFYIYDCTVVWFWVKWDLVGAAAAAAAAQHSCRLFWILLLASLRRNSGTAERNGLGVTQLLYHSTDSRYRMIWQDLFWQLN